MTRERYTFICVALLIVCLTIVGWFFSWIQDTFGDFGDSLLINFVFAAIAFGYWYDNRRLRAELNSLRTGDQPPPRSGPFEEEEGF